MLKTNNLVKQYNGRNVVNEVSVSINKGEVVGLLGPNGAGKTTTFYMITGMITPSSGSVYLDDRDITMMPMYKRSQVGIGYLSQDPSVFTKLSVENNLKLVLQMTGQSKPKQQETPPQQNMRTT